MTVSFHALSPVAVGSDLLLPEMPGPQGKGHMALAGRTITNIFGISARGYRQHTALNLPANSGFWTPDAPELHAGAQVIEIEMLVILDQWMTSGSLNQVLMSQRGGAGQDSWSLTMFDGSMSFQASTDGTTFAVNAFSTVTTRFAHGSAHWVKARFAGSEGGSRRLDYWTAMSMDEPGKQRWKPLGTQVTGAAIGALFNSTAPIIIGNLVGFGGQGMKGQVLYAELSYNGVPVTTHDFRFRPIGTPVALDAQGRAWNFDSPAAIALANQPTRAFDDSPPWAEVADHNGGTGIATDDHTTRIRVDRWEQSGELVREQPFRQGLNQAANIFFPVGATYPQTYDGGSIGTWTGASVNLAEGIANDQYHSGSGSLRQQRLTSTGPLQLFSGTGPGPKAIQGLAAGELIRTSMWVRHNDTVPRNFTLRHRHYNGTTLVNETDSAAVTVPPNTWRQLTYTSLTPAATNGMQIVVFTTNVNVGTYMWVDDVEVVRPGVLDAAARIAVYSRDGGIGFAVDQCVANDNTHGANRSISSTDTLDLKPGDMVVAFVASDTDTDLALTAPAITASGITFGTTTRRTTGGGVDLGWGANVEVIDAVVTAGTSAAVAPSLGFTSAVSSCGPAVFVRLREVPTPVSFWRPTHDALVNMDVPRRFDSFRFDVVDMRNNPIGTVHPQLDKTPTVSWDTTRAVHRSLDNFYLDASEANLIDPFRDRIRPWMVMQDGTEHSLGVFLYSDSSEPRRSWGYERQGQLLDKTSILDNKRPFAESIPTNRIVLQWVLEILNEFPEFADRIRIQPGYGDNWEAAVALVTLVTQGPEAAARQLRAPVTWAAESTTLKIFNDIMQLVTYLPVHCNRNGTLRLVDAPDLASLPGKIDYSVEAGSMYPESIVKSTDQLTAPNMVFVYETSVNSGVMWGVWHAPAAAPYSEANRGYTKAFTKAMSGLDDPHEANLVAKHISEWIVKAGDWVEWQGPANPMHDAYTMLNLFLDVAPDPLLDDRWMEVAWKLPCVAGQPMSHKALRVYANQDDRT